LKKFIFKKLDFFQKNPEKYSLGPLTISGEVEKPLFLRGDTPPLGREGVPIFKINVRVIIILITTVMVIIHKILSAQKKCLKTIIVAKI
jgi:hypothetical protein